ncbi:MAG TPA: hypothetical protein DHV55_05915 [Clostridiaceae bacterium]|nr:hypothetical protein [Clostridiaceae bacterium]
MIVIESDKYIICFLAHYLVMNDMDILLLTKHWFKWFARENMQTKNLLQVPKKGAKKNGGG